MRVVLGAIAIAMAMMTQPATANDEAFDRAVAAVKARIAPVDAQEGRIPGRALVFAKVGEAPVIDVRGIGNVETGQAANAQTPFYIASMTKAFVGLMAVRLDEMGIMPLDTTLAEAYPGMKVEGVDLAQVTIREALSHRMGFHSPALSLRTAYTDRVPVKDYAAIVSASNEITDAAFSYTNVGYILYAGALEQRTGRSWKSWLDELVLMPLGMRHSSARTSDLPETSFTHEIYDSGWRTYAPKSDAIMHAAGGMVVSAEDMARWLGANAGGNSAIPSSTFATAQRPLAQASRSQGPVQCTGYAFGWTSCEAGGIRFLEHGGTYSGARSDMIVLPDRGLGFAVMFNSDSMTGGLGFQLLTTFVMAYADQEDQLPSPQAFAQDYAEMADRYRTERSKSETQVAAGQWSPTPAALENYGGRYVHPGFGQLRLASEAGMLVGWLNRTELALTPIGEDHFAARLSTDNDQQDFKFARGSGGRVESIDWGGDVFRPE